MQGRFWLTFHTHIIMRTLLVQLCFPIFFFENESKSYMWRLYSFGLQKLKTKYLELSHTLGVACCFCNIQVPFGCCSSCSFTTAFTSTSLDHWTCSRTKGCFMEEYESILQSSSTLWTRRCHCSISAYSFLCHTSYCCSRNSQIWETEEMVSSSHGCAVHVRIIASSFPSDNQ